MASRFWLITLLAAAAIFWTWAMVARSGPTATLKSEHSQPAILVPAEEVVVTPDGKLYHKPSCTFIHGKPEMMSAREATEKGYTPDPRCMKEALTHPK